MLSIRNLNGKCGTLYPDSETEHQIVGVLKGAETIAHKKEKPL